MRFVRLVIALFCVGFVARFSFATAPESQPAVNLFAMGDWGSNATPQKQVAKALKDYVEQSSQHIDGMLLAGDNFYTPLTSTSDPMWQSLFEDMYDAKVLNFPFYVSLGNHDYQNGKNIIELNYAKEHPESRWKMLSNYYRVDLPQDHPLVTIFMLDSNQQVMSRADWSAQTAWLSDELSKPRTGQWLIACAHHPLYSNGNHGDNGVLQKDWGTLFAKHKLDLYVCGHDHDLQHLEMPGVFSSFILVGGGGQSVRPIRNDLRGPFSKSSYGFAAMSFTPDLLTIKFISKDGSKLHEFTRTPDGTVNVSFTTPSDKATTRSIGSITRDAEAPAKKNAD